MRTAMVIVIAPARRAWMEPPHLPTEIFTASRARNARGAFSGAARHANEVAGVLFPRFGT